MRGQSIRVPPDVAETIRALLGERGSDWLQELPLVAAVLAHRWQVTINRPFDRSLSYVTRAHLPDGTEAVLKISPWRDEARAEIRALHQYGGDGVCRLLAADEDHAALLLERLRPFMGLDHVAATNDDAATRIGAGLMRRLHRPAAELPDLAQFDRLSDTVLAAFARHRGTFAGPGPIPAQQLERAESIALDLLISPPAEALLHGDLHHNSILSAEREPWLAISPRGMLGDPCYEVGSFLLYFEPFYVVKQPRLLRRRLDIFAEELGYDRARMRDWGIVRAVLLACQEALRQHYGVEAVLATAENLLDL